jgi:Na+/H+ antiporter NhaD/arsenite permease-like protein
VGSAATLIGNPQNILIGQTLGLGFGQFLLDAGVPAGLGLGLTWAVIRIQYADRFHGEIAAMPADPPPAYDRWQSSKAIAVCVVLVGAFCFLPELPRHGVALTAAGVLLLSRRMSSRRTLALVDWQLLVLFIGLFVVNAALAATGAVGAGLEELRSLGLDVSRPAWLFSLGVVLSNLVSNVPATMLLLPAASAPGAGAILALSSTLAGNLLLVGSIANVIVVDGAKAQGVHIGVMTHLRTGGPVTLLTLLTAALWLTLRAP